MLSYMPELWSTCMPLTYTDYADSKFRVALLEGLGTSSSYEVGQSYIVTAVHSSQTGNVLRLLRVQVPQAQRRHGQGPQ